MAYAVRPQDFETWCARLFLAPRIVLEERRTGGDSTAVRDKFIPVQVRYWPEFLNCVQSWKMTMMGIGVGNAPFPPVFDSDRDVIGSEPEASTSLNNDFFKSVNKFNYNVRHILHPHDQAISDATRVIAVPTVGLGVYSNPDGVICDGSSRELKVGIGEIKAPWVLETAGAMAFVNRLPIEHFGEDFVAVTPWRDIKRNVVKGLTQLYHDMI